MKRQGTFKKHRSPKNSFKARAKRAEGKRSSYGEESHFRKTKGEKGCIDLCAVVFEGVLGHLDTHDKDRALEFRTQLEKVKTAETLMNQKHIKELEE